MGYNELEAICIHTLWSRKVSFHPAAANNLSPICESQFFGPVYSYTLPKKKFAQIRGKMLFDLFGLETYFLWEKSATCCNKGQVNKWCVRGSYYLNWLIKGTIFDTFFLQTVLSIAILDTIHAMFS